MWDLGTAVLAVVVVAGGALVLPPIARRAGGLLAVIGLFGVMHGGTWAPTVAALGVACGALVVRGST